MKEILRNSNGLRDQAKPRFLFDTVKEYQLDYIAILESKPADFKSYELAYMCANKNFTWSWTPPTRWSGGILVGVSLDKFQVQ
jgi:hypothetical protein